MKVCNDESGDEVYCKFNTDSNVMMIPSKNLYTGENNYEKYMSNIIYDLISNSVFQQKFLYNVQSINEDTDNYEVNHDELIIMESLIRKYYDSIQKVKSKMEKHNVYENISSRNVLDDSMKLFDKSMKYEPESSHPIDPLLHIPQDEQPSEKSKNTSYG